MDLFLYTVSTPAKNISSAIIIAICGSIFSSFSKTLKLLSSMVGFSSNLLIAF